MDRSPSGARYRYSYRYRAPYDANKGQSRLGRHQRANSDFPLNKAGSPWQALFIWFLYWHQMVGQRAPIFWTFLASGLLPEAAAFMGSRKPAR